ncbi:TPA: hypothetical protein O8L60_000070 [Enterobacter cloacae]|nr:hypothetical protein [Enterobacter cloacae]
MSTITKEWLQQTIADMEEHRDLFPGDLDDNHENVLSALRIAMASLEAEAVGEVVLGEYDDCGCHPDARVACIAADGQADWENFKDGTRLYTAPPVPVSVPFDFLCMLTGRAKYLRDKGEIKSPELLERAAAMLQGAEPVTTANKLPDGYVLVPVEPTAEMISSGIAAHFERNQIQVHDRPAPGPMECAYVAMLAAAPQQEVKP